MKILTDKQMVEIKNQALNKIFYALCEIHEKDKADESGAVRTRDNELLDIALRHLNSKPTPRVYGWINAVNLKGIFY